MAKRLGFRPDELIRARPGPKHKWKLPVNEWVRELSLSQGFERRFQVSMKVTTRQVNEVTIVDLSGQIKLGEGSSVLRDTVKDLLGKGRKKILLNLGDINYIDSSGIGELVSAYTSVRNQGGELKLLRLTKKVHDLLQITKLYTVFHILDDEAGAIAAFSS
jgi:anti-sigma B factor antagonist